MAEQIQPTKTEKEEDIKEIKHEHKHEHVHEDKKIEEKKETATPEAKQEQKKETKKFPSKPVIEKEEAIARGLSMHASKKHCMYICNFIKNKPVEQAISELKQVIKFKRPIPFKGEIPHRKYKGVMSGRYPIKTSALFIKLLKGLKGNIAVNGLELEKTRIYFASANWASRPARREGRKAKRTNVLIKAKEITGVKE